MDRFFGYARVLSTGAPLSTASITVFVVGTANLAVIFDDNLAIPTPKANSFVADGNGFFFFYAAVGKYDVRIEGGASAEPPYTLGDVPIGDVHVQAHVLADSTALGADHTVSGLTVGHVLTALTATTAAFQSLPAGQTPDHDNLVGLSDDDHPQYPLLVGRGAGQDIAGGVAAAEDLTLRGTAHPTVGDIFLNPDGGNVGIGRTPSVVLDVQGLIQSRSGGVRFPDGTTQITAAGAGTPSTWTVVGDNIESANIGNVGIGVSGPFRKLAVSTSDFGPVILFQEDPSKACSIEMRVDGVRLGEIAAGSNGLSMMSGPSGPAGRHIGVTAQADGKVGINTLTPVVRGLHVYGPQTIDPLRVQSDTGFIPGIAFLEGGLDRGGVRGTPQRILLRSRFGPGISVDIGGRVGSGLDEETPQASFHIRGGNSGITGLDTVHLRVESPAGADPVVELWDSVPTRRAILEGTDTYFRLAAGTDNGGLLVDPSNGFVGVGPPASGVTGVPALPPRRLSAFSRAGEPLQVHLETESGGAAGIDFYEAGVRRSRYRATSTAVEIEDENGVVITIDQSNSRVGIGVAIPTEELDVAGDVHAASFPVSSDERFKKDVLPLTECLPRVRRLQGVTYRWNSFYRNELHRGGSFDGPMIGLIAQEVEAQFPELVRYWSGAGSGEETPGGCYRGLDYQRFAAVLIEAVKELAQQVDTLEDRLNESCSS